LTGSIRCSNGFNTTYLLRQDVNSVPKGSRSTQGWSTLNPQRFRRSFRPNNHHLSFLDIFLEQSFQYGLDTSVHGTSAALLLLFAFCWRIHGAFGRFMDLKWRYKAFMPLIAALPLMYYALENPALRNHRYSVCRNHTVRRSLHFPNYSTNRYDSNQHEISLAA